MWLRLAAVAAFAVVPCAMAQDVPPQTVLTLDDAIARVAAKHPDLRLADGQQAVLAAEAQRDALRPPLRVGAEIENVFGSGPTRALDQAELTVTLASVLERGGKLDARRTLAQARIDALAPQRAIARLDVLAEVARRYLAITAARQRHTIALDTLAQRQRTVSAARQRLQAGASPESVLLTAQALQARAELDRDRAQLELAAARRQLALLWGARSIEADQTGGDALQLPAIPEFEVLAQLLDSTPELARLNNEQRLRDARLQLARSQASPDLDWQVGVRRLEGNNATALVGSVSLALGSAGRAQPDIRAAQAELSLLDIERQSQALQLYATLADAHGRYRAGQLEVARMRDEVLPALARADAAAERAYRAGATSYLDWAQLQAQRSDARQQQLAAAVEAQTALIEIQRLTGQPFVVTAQATP
ncbi:TolC family protein [Xanthomonas floridensis]|uniref:Cation transporter n=1 Tax=Xanthomonas floridensis TaxID=1843580 RepID=A0A1A9MEG2_9XANT|nr:TolC family protein [Xanthomonas floridensis]MEA5124889.1 TolC family protein [Xanthomonas floridensis]MEA5132563.1 TolC family protein [Xanthomonas floridensis]OAG68226.1 cation transporter [Xanthomonas floridensis]